MTVEPSRTAMITAVCRGRHRDLDPDPHVLDDRMRVIEIDHPATQQWKRERAAALGLPEHPNHVFVPVDLEQEPLESGLDRSGLDRSEPACFSWLGVTQYLQVPAILATLRAVAGCAPGSEMVFTYVLPPPHLDEIGALCLERNQAMAAHSGEQWRTLLTPHEATAMVGQAGLEVRENLDRAEVHTRYFAGRADGLTPYTLMGYLSAAVPTGVRAPHARPPV